MRHPQASLWALAQEAEVIAVGQVAEIIEGSGTSTRTARIHVAEYLAGSEGPFLPVVLFPGHICPEPARFKVGDEVLVFLGRSEIGLTVQGHADGVRHPSTPADLDDLRALLQLALNAKATSGADRERLRREWAVEALVRPATRRDGVIEIDEPLTRVLAEFEVREGPRQQPLTSVEQLSPAQLDRIVDALVRSPTLDQDWFSTADLLDHHASDGLDWILLEKIECGLLEPEPPDWVRHAINRLLRRRGSTEALTGALLERAATRDPVLRREILRADWARLSQTDIFGSVRPALDLVSLR